MVLRKDLDSEKVRFTSARSARTCLLSQQLFGDDNHFDMSSVPSISTDTSSAAYKKAKKQYLKTTKARNKDVELDWTPFRAAEKKYKAHFPPPDLSQVLDLATLDASRAEEIKLGGWCGSSNVVDYREIRLNHNGDRKAYSIPSIPGATSPASMKPSLISIKSGLVVLPSFLSPDDQRHLIQWSLTGQARNPNPTNLDAHYLLPDEGLWNAYAKSRKGDFLDETVQPRTFSSTENTPEPPGPRKLIANQSVSPSNFHTVSSSPKTPPTPSTTLTSAPCSALIRKLRWANIGWYYHWGTKQYDFTRGKADINPEIRNVCKKAVESINWEDVFGVSSDLTWGEDGPDWRNWTNSYGNYISLHQRIQRWD